MRSFLRSNVNTVLSKLGYKLIAVHPHDNVEPTLKKGPKSGAPERVVIGGGDTFYGSDWHNIEYVTKGYSDKYKTLPKNIDIPLDLSSCPQFPIKDNSLEALFTSHVIEHLEDKHVQNILDNCYRTLNTGGVFRISCPDIDLYLRALRDNDLDFFHYRHVPYYTEAGIKDSISGLFLDVFTRVADKKMSRESILELVISKGEEEALDFLKKDEKYNPEFSHFHINWFNFNKLRRMLEKSGFKVVYKSGKGQSFYPGLRNMNVFDTGDPKISLFVEARK